MQSVTLNAKLLYLFYHDWITRYVIHTGDKITNLKCIIYVQNLNNKPIMPMLKFPLIVYVIIK